MRLGCAVAVFFMTMACNAQEDAARAKVRSEVDAARQASRSGADTFLDTSKPAAARLAAVKDLTAFVDRGDATSALELVRDPEQPAEIRVRALELGSNAIERDQELGTELLALAASRNTPPALRRAIVEVFRVQLIAGGSGGRTEDIIAALRALATDPDSELRAAALSILASNNDDVAREILVKDLRDPSTELVPPETAVSLLALYPSGDTLPVLREVLAHPPNETAQLEAARALGPDPQSHAELQKLVSNDDASDELRMSAAGALWANAPDKLTASAVPVVNDEGASDQLRVFTIKAVQSYQESKAAMHTPGPESADEKKFEEAVRKMAAKTKSAVVREVAKQYNLQKK